MADDLDRYLEVEYRADKDEVAEIGDLNRDVADVLVRYFLDSEASWPYALVNGSPQQSGRYPQ